MLRIYTTKACGYCIRAKHFMNKQGIQFHEIKVDEDRQAAHDLVHMTGQMGVPVIANDSNFIVGFDPRAIAALAKGT